MRPFLLVCTLVPTLLGAQGTAPPSTAGGFSLAQVMGAPFPTNLTAASRAERLAWTLNERGVRNVYVAEGPAFTARRLTPYAADDGQELSAVTLSPDGAHVLYVRGGDFGSNWDDALPVNPVGLPIPPRTELWTIPFGGGTPVSLGEGLNPVVSPDGRTVVFERGRQLWRAPIDGSAPAVKLTELRGSNGEAVFAPDGKRFAFVSNRGDHAFIGVYTDATTPIQWIAPSSGRDRVPRWSPDGTRLVFARVAADLAGDPADGVEPVGGHRGHRRRHRAVAQRQHAARERPLHRWRDQPGVAGGRPDHLPVLPRRLAAPVRAGPGGNRGTAAAVPGRAPGGAHHRGRRGHPPAVRRERRQHAGGS
jgi:hypothetical protein